MAVDCDASSASTVDADCSYDVGETFQIAIHATDAGGGYAGYQVKPRWADAILDYLPAAVTADENQWPITCIAARVDNQPADPSVLYSCASFPVTLSTHVGSLTRLQMICQSAGATAVTLVPRIGDTQGGSHFIDDFASVIDPTFADAQINCLEATPTATPTPTITATPTSSPTPAPLAGAMAVDCDASSASTVEAACTYDVGETFQIAVHATDADAGYVGYQVKPRWTDTVLDYLPAADENQWPLTCIAARVDNQPGDPSVVSSCASFPVALSTHLGSLTQFQMTCQSAGTTAVTLVPRLGDAQGGSHFVDIDALAMDPLLTAAQVTCSQAATATPTATLTPTITPTPPPSPTPAPLAGAMAVDCDAFTSGIDTDCTYDVGETFQIAVHATDADAGYAGYQVKPRWTSTVLDYLPAADAATENQWPVTCLNARVDNQPTDPSVVYSCGSFPVALSTHLGYLTQFQMTCQSAGATAVTLVPRLGDAQGGSHFVDIDALAMDPLLTDAQVTCSQAATATPTATLTPTITATPPPSPTPAPLAGAMAVDCDASTSAVIDTDCTYGVGETFQIAVHATDADAGYAGYQVKPRWTSTVLDYLPAAAAATENQWPVTCLNARVDNQPTDPSVVYSCGSFPVALSTHLGYLTQLQMTCQSAGTTAVTLVPRLGDAQGGSHFVDQLAVAMDPLLTDAQVTCSQAATATPTGTLTATPTLTPIPTPTGEPDLLLTKSDSLDPVSSDAVYQYSLLIENLGQADAIGVIVEDELPEMLDGSLVLQVEPVDPLPPSCTFNTSLRIVRCDLGDIPAGESRVVDLTVRAPMTLAVGPQNDLIASNCAAVDPDLAIAEEDETNNSDCELTTILWNCPDFDGNNQVSLTDLAFITLHWRHEVGVDEDGDGDVSDRRADLDQNGSVGLVDLALVALHWRETCPAP